jgi:hypothetical protein
MNTKRVTHDQREQSVLSDLEACFPSFSGSPRTWIKVPDGQDPPDFLSHTQPRAVGLELIEWLEGGQMGLGKVRESQRDNLRRVLSDGWRSAYQPQNFRLAVAIPNFGLRMAVGEEAQLRKEFFSCVENADKTWVTNPERVADSYFQNDLSSYVTLRKFINSIRYIGGEPHSFCWIDIEQDGGAYDPTMTIETLKQALDKKMNVLSSPKSKTKLERHKISELYLLVHGGFNAYLYNTPSGPLSLEEIARRGAEYYASHPLKGTCNRVWFFDSLNSADDINQLFGYPPGYGRVRWLAQLWPHLSVYPGSVAY